MSFLGEVEFTEHLVEKLKPFGLPLSVPAPLSIQVAYGEDEPLLTVKLATVYDEYKDAPDRLEELTIPFITEIGWTASEPRHAARTVYEQSLPIMRDLNVDPLTPDEAGEKTSRKGPLIFQELIDRPEENLVVQFVLKEKDEQQPTALYLGDILNCFPDIKQVGALAHQNLKTLTLESGLTLTEYPIENFETKVYSVGLRAHRKCRYVASLLTIPEVMNSVEGAIQAADGVVAIAPCQDMMLVGVDVEENSIAEMGLLARFLKSKSNIPATGFVWRFKGGALQKVQTVDVDPSPGN